MNSRDALHDETPIGYKREVYVAVGTEKLIHFTRTKRISIQWSSEAKTTSSVEHTLKALAALIEAREYCNMGVGAGNQMLVSHLYIDLIDLSLGRDNSRDDLVAFCRDKLKYDISKGIPIIFVARVKEFLNYIPRLNGNEADPTDTTKKIWVIKSMPSPFQAWLDDQGGMNGVRTFTEDPAVSLDDLGRMFQRKHRYLEAELPKKQPRQKRDRDDEDSDVDDSASNAKNEASSDGDDDDTKAGNTNRSKKNGRSRKRTNRASKHGQLQGPRDWVERQGQRQTGGGQGGYQGQGQGGRMGSNYRSSDNFLADIGAAVRAAFSSQDSDPSNSQGSNARFNPPQDREAHFADGFSMPYGYGQDHSRRFRR
ncbi:hypothetical protein THAOC_10491 [Thalassiosira oceanica]|uniref:Uncharacterized protein n=1 Tax=Thalassiosira oceanica TaxID=159749 RepID=K0TCW7_THAOC|nr:hypothetical protein THAOC_10491 [Thalassiosira oceanica]|eukprot:EJK68337.1 hypothetical protein THAOC_10491 [Thalassiosira oceanica]